MNNAAGWIFKTEPSTYSADDLRREKRCRWEGVRNYQARNFLRQARVGDPVALWHSGSPRSGVAGLARVLKAAYPDPTAFDPTHGSFDPKSDPANPRWFSVDLGFVDGLEPCRSEALESARLRKEPALAGLLLFRQGRLSVCPVDAAAWKRLSALAGWGKKA